MESSSLMTNKIILISYLFPARNPGVTNLHFLEGKLRKEFFYKWSWTNRFSEHLRKHRPDYEIECWNCYSPKDYHDLGVYRAFENGVSFIQFPITEIGPAKIPFTLFKEFRKRVKNGEKFIAHHQAVNTPSPNLLTLFFPSINHVAQQRGGDIPPVWKLRFKKKFTRTIEKWFYSLTLNKFKYIISDSIGAFRYNVDKLGKEREIFSKGGGFDFGLHKVKSKTKLRKDLGLPLEKRLLIFVGKFRSWRNKDKFGGGSGKGLGIALEAYKILKEKHNLEMIFIGGTRTADQDLYDDVVNSGGIMKHFMPHAEAMKYINAADVLLLPTMDKEWIPFGGICSAIIDSLAVNTPVISPMLIHFSGNKSERKKLGIIPHNLEEVVEGVEYILSNPEEFAETRNIVKKYYSWDYIISKNSKVYDTIFNNMNE